MTDLTFHGRVAWVFPDHFDVDQIVGVENIRTYDMQVLRPACMAEYTPGFADEVAPGDLLVAGRNFGYGHPHDQAMSVMREIGISCVVAESFGLMFERSWQFLGLPLLRCAGIAAEVERWDELSVDWERGRVHIARTGRTLQGVEPSRSSVAMARAGGGSNLIHAEPVQPG